ncbi:MAG: hypothetical protein ACJ8GW_01420 [Massilia sp.]
MKKLLALVIVTAMLGGCATSSVVVGTVRPAISPTAVKLYLHPPKKFEEVALLESNSQASFAFTEQGKMDVVIERMKEEAAKLGANGILLNGTRNQQVGSIGTGSFSGNVGIGVSGGLVRKSGNGVAIFVVEE